MPPCEEIDNLKSKDDLNFPTGHWVRLGAGEQFQREDHATSADEDSKTNGVIEVAEFTRKSW